MLVDRIPSPALTPSDIYRAYVAVLPKWLHRFKVPKADIADVMQEVWLAVCSGSVASPNSVSEARLELFKVTRVVAQRLRRRRDREGYRFVPETEDKGYDFFHKNSIIENDLAAFALGVFEAFEQLTPEHQRLAREYYVLGYTMKEMAERDNIPEDRMEKRVWRVRLELEKFAQKDRRLEERNKKHQRGLLVVPFAFDLDPEIRAAFCSIWESEGNRAVFGGGGNGGNPPSRPFARPFFPIAPFLSSMAGSVVAAVGLGIVLLMLVFFPVSLVALHYFWKPGAVKTAQTGLRVTPYPMPSVGVIEDVVPVYPTNPPVSAQTVPRAPRPQVPRKSIPVPDELTSGPAFERGGAD